jgi:hypothetical protein
VFNGLYYLMLKPILEQAGQLREISHLIIPARYGSAMSDRHYQILSLAASDSSFH